MAESKEERKPILEFEGDLICRGVDPFPRPGTVRFDVADRADILVRDIVEIHFDKLPDVATIRHLSGKMRIEIYDISEPVVDYTKLTPQKLRVLCREKGVSAKGTKSELLKRLGVV